MLSMQWIKLEKVQRIMHPSHHPFHPKTKASQEGWFANSRPVGRLFCNRLNIGEISEDCFVKILDKGDRFEIAISTMFIRLPLSMSP